MSRSFAADLCVLALIVAGCSSSDDGKSDSSPACYFPGNGVCWQYPSDADSQLVAGWKQGCTSTAAEGAQYFASGCPTGYEATCTMMQAGVVVVMRYYAAAELKGARSACEAGGGVWSVQADAPGCMLGGELCMQYPPTNDSSFLELWAQQCKSTEQVTAEFYNAGCPPGFEGSCELTQGQFSVTMRFYPAVPLSVARDMCSSSGGVWQP